MSTNKEVYLLREGRASMKPLLGSKGANLAEMMSLGLPVPPGFIITTESCNRYFEAGGMLSEQLKNQVKEALKILESETGKKFGDPECPLLVSVRSGAVISMPGMMDTILNLGLNRETLEGLARQSGSRRFALDCYRRFIQMFGEVVLKLEFHLFDKKLEDEKKKQGITSDTELEEAALEEIMEGFLYIIERKTGQKFPDDPLEQLFCAIQSVFDSWNSPRAIVYRKANKIPHDLGTAVNVQVMAFGNLGDDCGTGVIFTRNPSNGENKLYGEYLINAQGEDVVAGVRTPEPIEKLNQVMPGIYSQLLESCQKLEQHYRDMQDIEFTIEKGRLYMLQTRTGKRTAAASVNIAVDMVNEGLISIEEAILRASPEQLEQLLHRQIDSLAELEVLAAGLPASPGAATGLVVFDADTAVGWTQEGKNVLLVRTETTPDDIHGIIAAQGVLTSRGGMTSHAAVVARGMGKPCVCGCESLSIDTGKGRLSVGDVVIKQGEKLSIDGTTGRVIMGEVPMIEPEIGGSFQILLEWADRYRSLKVRANADTPEDARRALQFGAEGIGLCRTEHMFFAPGRLPVVREMILAATLEEREEALKKLLPMQREDFKEILRAMAGFPVTVRLLDPPLHEFLPDRESLLLELSKLREQGKSRELSDREALWQKVKSLSEVNPMLGHRGCRLGLVYPEIYRMQVQAALEAVAELREEGMDEDMILLEIMIPLVGHIRELEIMQELVSDVIAEIAPRKNMEISCPVGTMIELPRACVTAGEIAKSAEFFSFGTNDLTQTTFGFSRDDAEGKFLPFYLEQKVLTQNPFMEIDRDGVGRLVQIAAEQSRAVKPQFKLGICGEQGGNPESIEFFHQVGLDYVSCSPYRVPIARLAAAQARLKETASL